MLLFSEDKVQPKELFKEDNLELRIDNNTISGVKYAVICSTLTGIKQNAYLMELNLKLW